MISFKFSKFFISSPCSFLSSFPHFDSIVGKKYLIFDHLFETNNSFRINGYHSFRSYNSSLSNYYGDNPRYLQELDVYEASLKQSKQLIQNVSTFSLLLAENKFEEATSFLLLKPISDIQLLTKMWEQLVEKIISMGFFPYALQIFPKLSESGIVPTSGMWVILIRGACSEKRTKLAFDLIIEFREHLVQEAVVINNDILMGRQKEINPPPSSGENTLSKIQQQREIAESLAWYFLLECYSDSGAVSETLEIFETMVKLSIKIDVNSLELIFKTIMKAKEYKLAIFITKVLFINKGYPIRPFIWNGLMKASLSSQDLVSCKMILSLLKDLSLSPQKIFIPSIIETIQKHYPFLLVGETKYVKKTDSEWQKHMISTIERLRQQEKLKTQNKLIEKEEKVDYEDEDEEDYLRKEENQFRDDNAQDEIEFQELFDLEKRNSPSGSISSYLRFHLIEKKRKQMSLKKAEFDEKLKNSLHEIETQVDLDIENENKQKQKQKQNLSKSSNPKNIEIDKAKKTNSNKYPTTTTQTQDEKVLYDEIMKSQRRNPIKKNILDDHPIFELNRSSSLGKRRDAAIHAIKQNMKL